LSQASQPRPSGADDRTPDARAADHAAIGRLADELLPALVAKLAATGLGEIEVREGGWKVRLRRPTTTGGSATPSPPRRQSDRPSRPQPGHEGHGHAPGALEGHRSARLGQTSHSTNGSGPPPAVPVGRPQIEEDADTRRKPSDPHRAIATSPAVGIFRPRQDAAPGTRVRAGDRIGIVDMLGVPQDVLAPADGIVASVFVEAGDAVEYGQDLVALELTTQAATGGGGVA
jgi:biotin carboxyl carrier protein